jgi:hypothetical protein
MLDDLRHNRKRQYSGEEDRKMSDQVFYVGATKDRQLTGYVPAKFLAISGKPVVDPTPGGSQKTYIYADGSEKFKTRGEIAIQTIISSFLPTTRRNKPGLSRLKSQAL